MRRHLTFANAASALSLFLVVTGGTAVALAGKNTVFSSDIVDGQVKSADVRNDILSGADVAERSLGPVPSADSAQHAANAERLAGLGPSAFSRPILKAVEITDTRNDQQATEETLFSAGGLTAVGSCDANDTVVGDSLAAVVLSGTQGTYWGASSKASSGRAFTLGTGPDPSLEHIAQVGGFESTSPGWFVAYNPGARSYVTGTVITTFSARTGQCGFVARLTSETVPAPG